VVSIQVTLPEACDRAMARDGIDAKPPAGSAIGEKSWWLRQMLACVSPTAFVGEAPIEAVLAAAKETDVADALVAGWSRGAARRGPDDWVVAMLHRQAGLIEHLQDERLVDALASALPPGARDSAATAILAAQDVRVTAPTVRALLMVGRTGWSEAVSGAVIESLRRSPRTDPIWVYALGQLAPQIGARVATTLQPELCAVAELPGQGMWASAMGNLVEMVQFRATMQNAIKEI
jgi:hypothetical protein